MRCLVSIIVKKIDEKEKIMSVHSQTNSKVIHINTKHTQSSHNRDLITTQERNLNRQINELLKKLEICASKFTQEDSTRIEASLHFMLRFNALTAALRQRHGDMNLLLGYDNHTVKRIKRAGSRSVATTLINDIVSRCNPYQMVERVLFFELDVNQEDENGITPLIAAVIHEDLDTIKSLLKLGACPLMHNQHGHTALMFAVEVKNEHVIALFRPARHPQHQSQQ